MNSIENKKSVLTWSINGEQKELTSLTTKEIQEILKKLPHKIKFQNRVINKATKTKNTLTNIKYCLENLLITNNTFENEQRKQEQDPQPISERI